VKPISLKNKQQRDSVKRALAFERAVQAQAEKAV